MLEAHPEDSAAPPVTICCAASDGAAVREAAEALMARGHQVELAVGVDVDQAVLTRAIAAQHGRGLYVLCRSHALERNAVDELREVLRTHDVPFGRTLTLAVDTQRPREVEERIVSVLRRMVTGRQDGRPRAWGPSAPTHEEDPDTTIRKPGGSPVATDATALIGLGTEPENADPYASTSQIEMAAVGHEVDPPYSGADHTAIRPTPLAHPPAASVLPPSNASMTHTAPPPGGGPRPMPTAASVLPPSNASMTHTAPQPGGGPRSMPAAPLMQSAAPMPVAPVPSMSMPAASTQSAAPPLLYEAVPPAMTVPPTFAAPPMAASSMAEALSAYTPPPVSADESSADFDAPLTMGSRMGRALGSPAGLAVALGGLAIVALVVVAAVVLGGDDDEPTKITTAAADTAPKADAKTGDTSKPEAKAEPETKAEAEAEPDAKPEPDAKVEPEPEAKPEPDAKTEPEAEDEPTPEPEPPPAAAADPGDALPARTFAPEDDPPEVVAALRSREVRAIDVFVVAPERKGTLTFDQAVGYCTALEVAGLTGWRVPSIGELNALATAKMLGKAIFWSSTAGDSFGDLRLVLGAKKGTTIVAVPKTWDGAKIVCIRLRQG